jgi:uncharacterized membrane protein YfcA
MLPLLFSADVLSLYPYWRKWDLPNVLVLTPGAVVGIALGTWALGMVSDALLGRAIGAMAITFALAQIVRSWLLRNRPAFEPRLWHGSIAGFGTGFVSTLSHVGGVLTTMYLLPQKLDNERFVGTTTAVYFLVNLCKIPAYLKLDLLSLEIFQRDLLVLPAVLAGTALGVYLNRRVPGAVFTRVVLAVVLISGVALLVRG